MQDTRKPTVEYIILIAMLSSVVALGTDIMLPGLSIIGTDLNVADPNSVHYIVATFFFGFALGQLLVGPLSDSFGRKPVVYAGFGLFVIGCGLSLFAETWTAMLVGRALQGLGAAARIVTIALVRDEYSGRPMARIMSIVFAVFILVPMIAPAIGQGLIYLGGWRLTFVALAVFASVLGLWFAVRQPETLAPENRRAFSAAVILGGYKEVLFSRIAFGYTLAAGLIFGAFMGYLGSAQQIFREVFLVGDLFAVYFAVAAAAIGSSSLLNASLVMRFGMFRLSFWALAVASGSSILFLLLLSGSGGVPSLTLFMFWLLIVFFCMGIVFANFNALAMEPMGHIAGLAAAFVGAVSTFISLPFAALIGSVFNGTVYPLVIAFAVLGVASCITILWTEGGYRARRQK